MKYQESAVPLLLHTKQRQDAGVAWKTSQSFAHRVHIMRWLEWHTAYWKSCYFSKALWLG